MQDLYEDYSKSFRSAIDGVFADGSSLELADCLRANVSRFAAYKASYVEKAVKQVLNDENTPVKERENLAKAVLRTFSRFQDAEHTTATARARTAKQFSQFMQPDNVRLFPNLRWLPSRSADPRASHTRFYDRVWAKNDPFWNNNAPGTEWNCKCDIEETDEPVTDNSKLELPKTPHGLEGNPAETGEIFTDEASYIRKAAQGTEQPCRKANRNMMAKLGRIQNRSRSTTCEIDGTEYEFDFEVFRSGNGDKVDICHHFTASMFGDADFWLKNEIMANPKPYLKNGHLVGRSLVDHHNTGRATIALKDATDRFFYIKTKLANGNDVILHIGRYSDSQKLYLYSASKELPDYIENSR